VIFPEIGKEENFDDKFKDNFEGFQFFVH